MTRRRYLHATLLLAGVFSAGFAAITLQSPRARLMWNASASAPIGLYWIDHDASLRVGDLVAISPPEEIARFLDGRHYLPSGVPLIKHVAALPGQRICRDGAIVTRDGRLIAVAKMQDRMGRALPVWRGCRRLHAGQVFLLNPALDSLDGRYFGSLPAAGLIGNARPILTRAAPGEPLRWRTSDTPTAFPTTNKEKQP